MRLDRRSADPEARTPLRPRKQAPTRARGSSSAPSVEPSGAEGGEVHAPFVASAQAVFGNRAVGAALRGEAVEGPEALLHTVIALGSAGIYVGKEAAGTLPNSVLVRLLAGRPVGAATDPFSGEAVDGPSADALGVGASGFGALGADGLGASAVGAEGLGASGFGSPSGGTAGGAVALSRAVGTGGGPSAGERVARARQTAGAPIPDAVRQDLEARFGASFAGVRVHTDGAAQAAADAVEARAYTVGQEIWFGAGQWAPGTPDGLELLAHELTHVLQNRRGDARGGGGEVIDGVAVSSPGDAREREAEAAGAAVRRDSPVSVGAVLPAAPVAGPDADASVDGALAQGAASGASSFGGAGAELSRDASPDTGDTQDKKPVTRKLPDGSTVQVHEDGDGGYYIVSPQGDRLATDAEGNPTEAALDKMSAKARKEGESKPKPAQPEKQDPGSPEAGTKKDKEKATGGGGAGGASQEAPGAGGGEGATAGGLPDFGTLSAGPLGKYVNEKAWHDTWKAKGAQTGSLDTVTTGENLALMTDALASGGAEGFINGAQSVLVDAVLAKATKNIPYASGFIAIAQIAYDPKKWWEDTVVTGIGSKLGGGWDKLTSGESDWIDRFEGVISILEGLNNIIGLASTVCMIVAAAGFILSFICPALIPFVALAAKWGLLLGEISTIVGLGINLLRGICVVARAVQVAIGDADPATQAKRAEKLKAMMASWSENVTKRQGAKLQQKLAASKTKKADGAAEKPAGGTAKPGDGAPAASQKQGWKDRARTIASGVKKVADEAAGISATKDAYKKTFKGDASTGTASTLKSTKDVTRAYRGKGPARQRWGRMQAADPALVPKSAQARYEKHLDKKGADPKVALLEKARASNPALAENVEKNRAALASNREGKGLVKDDGRSALGDRDASAATVRKKAADPDFWEPTAKAERKLIRRRLERSEDPADRAMAKQMVQAERRLREFETGKRVGPGKDDNAVVRVTTESGLRAQDSSGNARLTAGKRAAQGVTRLQDSRGRKSAEETADKLGFEKSYTKGTRDGADGKGGTYTHTNRAGQKREDQDHFVAVLYTPSQKPTRSDTKGMVDLIQKHGNGDGLFGKKRGEIEANVTRAMNTPRAPQNAKGEIDEAAVRARPDLYRSMRVQQQKQALESRLGANEQKTGDGRTLTEDRHRALEQEHVSRLDAIQGRDVSDSRKGRAVEREQARYGRSRKGDSYPEYYDTQLAPGKTDPLAVGSARKLSEYDQLPVVRRLDWGEKTASGLGREGRDAPSTESAPAVASKPGSAATTFARNAMNGTTSEFTKKPVGENETAATEWVRRKPSELGALLGLTEASSGAKTDEWKAPGSLRGTERVKEGTGLIDRLTTVDAVNADGTPRLDTSGKAGKVGIYDRAKSLATGGLAGRDASGEDNNTRRNAEFVAREQAELEKKLGEFDTNFVSATDRLTDPPADQEGEVDSAAQTWAAYDAEIGRLREQAALNEELKADAATAASHLETEQQAAQANTTSIASQKTELSTKKENQTSADQKIGEQSAKGGELSGATGSVIGTVAGFVSGFMEMCGMIPSSLSSSGANASAGAENIRKGVTDSNASGKQTEQKSEQETAVVEEHRATTEAAEQSTSDAEQELTGLTQTIGAEKAATEAGRSELQAADGLIAAKIEELEEKKATEEARQQGAIASMSGWADTHVAARTGQKTEGDKALDVVEQQAEELKKKAADGGDGASAPSGGVEEQPDGGTLPPAVQGRMDATFGGDGGGLNPQAFAYGSAALSGEGR